MTPPRLAPSGYGVAKVAEAKPEWAQLVEFPDIGHAPLLEIPDRAVETVTSFFHEVLEREGLLIPAGAATT
jgi:pimeloyl-ACP methyl ester carboxylesterase